MIARFADPRSGDRSYATNAAAPSGYVTEGRPFHVSAAAFEGSRPLYLCNAPFERPSSPEHFLSTDGTCEGRQMVGLLGHIGTSRDGRTPRSLLRCTRTVKSPLLTNRRHVATVDFDDCRDDTIEAVLGYVR